MRRRLLRSVLAAAFSGLVAIGALSGAGLVATDSVPGDSGWGAPPAVSTTDAGTGQVALEDSGWGAGGAKDANA